MTATSANMPMVDRLENPPTEPVVQARNVGVVRSARHLLADIDLDVRTGEVIAVVGPNGAGKSTLLSVLAGDLHPDRGEVTLFGAPIRSWNAGDAARRRAVLPQQVTVSFPFTVQEIVAMGRAPWARTPHRSDDANVILRAMEQADITTLADRTFPTLSGGEKARVALARVLAQQAPVLLLDEPTAALDIRHQELVLGVARHQADKMGAAVVAVLHDLGLAAAYADRIVVLHAGRIAATGPPSEVLTSELLSDVYQHPVDVLPHPHGRELLILPRRWMAPSRDVNGVTTPKPATTPKPTTPKPTTPDSLPSVYPTPGGTTP